MQARYAMKLIVGLPLTLCIYLITGAHALGCYNCHYENPDCVTVEPQCSEASPSYMKTIQNSYFPNDKTDYDDPKKLPKPVCYSAKEEDKNGETKESRKCSPLGSKLTCEVIKIEATNERQSKLLSCKTCSEDFCNSAAITTSMSSVATVFLLVSVTFLFVSL